MPTPANAWLNGFLGIAIFSASLPATRIAVAELDPVFLTTARAAIAGILALVLLRLFRVPGPRRADAAPLAIVALGVVVGFPLLTALALRHMISARAIVYTGLLPLATAIFGVLRAGDRPRPAFWIFAVLGSAAVAAYALRGGDSGITRGDALMLAAIVLCGLGYAEGGRLARTLGGWQVISWALVASLPIMLPLSALLWPDWHGVGAPAIGGLLYVSIFSMLIGFVFWYRGLAAGGIAAVSQLQLAQPFLGLALAAGLLGEKIGWDLALAAGAVVLCVAASRHFAR
jgi:drug/metabolite transporter (DMT)-like permease